ncbi:aldose 1-epimerase [Flavobacterium noncentrifugens]|uniref:Galactose mutarotase n=1 Tax=Flavobacterium noncentrifugens TaxID=1128970 RepID=A0A1G8WDX1_9FLAO|nr:aldose 1-epimerase family protein [Flavobacterium noncentrifugens]GEP50888.1 aldose 1-epimerase [Flavobacterium noncentrifugens]SDJ76549.1 Galactose mutarotase [Flavobacterium noncentrifugens]
MHTIISKSGIIARFLENGAELISLKNHSGKEYIWEGNPKFWGKHSPVLFPIVGTLKNDSYLYNNQQYHLSRHGFARDREFSVLSKSENSIVFSLTDSDETLNVYPFHFELQVEYTLNENSLKTRYRVINKNDFEMPFSLGAHPAFALSENFEDYSLKFETNQELAYHLLDKDLISDQTSTLHLTDKTLTLGYKLFENDALVFKSVPAKKITILENGKPRIKVGFSDFPDLGIWTKVGAPFLCIEPWFGYSDSAASNGNLIEKGGIQILNPKKTFEAAFSIEIF